MRKNDEAHITCGKTSEHIGLSSISRDWKRTRAKEAERFVWMKYYHGLIVCYCIHIVSAYDRAMRDKEERNRNVYDSFVVKKWIFWFGTTEGHFPHWSMTSREHTHKSGTINSIGATYKICISVLYNICIRPMPLNAMASWSVCVCILHKMPRRLTVNWSSIAKCWPKKINKRFEIIVSYILRSVDFLH